MASTRPAAPKGPLPPEIQAALRDALQAEGAAALMQRAGVSQTALLQGASGLPVRKSTAAVIRLALTQDRAA